MRRFCNNCGDPYEVPIEAGKERRRAFKSPFCQTDCQVEMNNKKRVFKKTHISPPVVKVRKAEKANELVTAQ